MESLLTLNRRIEQCTRCPRLVRWRENVATVKTRRFQDWTYWGKPVPGFGDPQARLLVVGLAPAAHGGNRTGRMFTGDRSGDWLYKALHKFGFANQARSETRQDGLRLTDCYVTAACRCAPPANKPTPLEMRRCRPFLSDELTFLRNIRVVIGLGKVGFEAAFIALTDLDIGLRSQRLPRFGHGVEMAVSDHITMLASYHPSQQNTFTGRLTESMFLAVFQKAHRTLSKLPKSSR